jgi:hypothetical protein
MISDILAQAKSDIEQYLLGDDRGYSSEPDLCDQIWKLLQDMEALRLRLDSPADSPSVERADGDGNANLKALLKPIVHEYLDNGDSARFKSLLEQAAMQIEIV